MMVRCARHRFGVPALVRMVIVSLLALGIMAGGVGLRQAAASAGCDLVNAKTTEQLGSTGFVGPVFDAGDVVSVTAGPPDSGSPTTVQILNNNALVASAPYPGAASYTIPSTGAILDLTFGVNTGTATLDLACLAAPATVTPTDTPTEAPTETPIPTDTPTNTPTVTDTPTGTQTPPPGATDTPLPTETAIPATEAPTETAAACAPPAATATSETTGGVTDLPNTGSSPGSGSGRTEVWLLVALLAVTGVGITGVRAKRSR
jgi:hypothetical protein